MHVDESRDEPLAPAVDHAGAGRHARRRGWIDRHDPIAPVEDCGRLAAVIPGSQTWITDLEAPGPFGTHIQAYRMDPAAYVGRVAGFLDGAL